MPIRHLHQLVNDELSQVDAVILEKIQLHLGLIDKLSRHILQSGGKRLRPLTVLLSSLACGYEGSEHITLAAVIEYIHTATLLHDDVIDESDLRRGNRTANTIWGCKASILVGDYLITEYIQMVTAIGNIPIMQLLANTLYQISCGEITQLENRGNENLTEEEYFNVIRNKTSLLFAASANLGPLISGKESIFQKALYDFGLHLGNAFQLIDDTLDYCAESSETLGKNIGDDFTSGHLTLPLIHALKNSTPIVQKHIKSALKEGSLAHLPIILEAIEATNGIGYTKHRAEREMDRAITALHVLPDSKYKTGLIDLAGYALSRNH